MPFELDVSVTLESLGWVLWQRQQKEGVLLGFWFQLWKGTETQYTLIDQQLLAVYTAFLQVGPLMKEQHMVRASLPIKEWVLRLCAMAPPLPRLPLTL